MAKHLDKFTNAFRNSRIPFLLAEVITDGQGTMVDLACRFANDAAGALLQIPAEELRGQRFTRSFPHQRLQKLRALESVAFSGSAASFIYDTNLGQTLSITCYQPMYGMVCCLLEPVRDYQRESTPLSVENLPAAAAVIELSRSGVRCLSFNPRLCTLSGWSRTELLNRFGEDFSALVEQEDWPALLQELLDAARDGRSVDHEFRLRRNGLPSLWVALQADILPLREGVYSIHALLLDVDQRRRAGDRLSANLRQLADSQRRLMDLLAGLPGCRCLLRREGETLTPLLVSQGLSDMLKCSTDELTRRLTVDPLWCVPEPERDALLAAAAHARNTGASLCHACHLRLSDRPAVWVSLEIVWQAQADGTHLLYATCSDQTSEMNSQLELRLRAQMCDLLLDRSRILSLDYDPVTDTVRIDRHNDTGHRKTRTIQGYRASLASAAVVHPDDRRKLAAVIKRLSARAGAETVEYRGDYDGQGWRWYRLSWMSVFDDKGNVTRLLGKSEDISQSKAAAQRFRQLTVRQKKLLPGVLASARLDLAVDRILDAKGSSRHLSRVLFGNSADACLRHLRDNVPDGDQRGQFDALFRRDTLLDAFHRGETVFSLEHHFIPGSGNPVWARTSVELAEDPDTLHITAFCTVSGIDVQRYETAVLDALVRRGYDFVLTVNAADGTCRLWGGGEPLPPNTTYRALAAQYLRGQAATHQRTALRRAVRLDTLLSQLDGREFCEYTGMLDTPDGPRSKRFCCSWLDREAGILLLTLEAL